MVRLKLRKPVLISQCIAPLVLLLQATSASQTDAEFKALYDHYFPSTGPYLNTALRRDFDAMLFGPPPASKASLDKLFYNAFHGDQRAFHNFLHARERGGEGYSSLVWDYECVVLLLRLGDDQFAKLLAKEDRRTRETVGAAIDTQIDWDKHDFPRTRAQYSYRFVPPSKQELDQRQRVAVAVSANGFSQDEVNRLTAALKKENRFSQVEIVGTDQPGEPNVITAPKSLSKRDLSDLKRLLRRELRGNKSVSFDNIDG